MRPTAALYMTQDPNIIPSCFLPSFLPWPHGLPQKRAKAAESDLMESEAREERMRRTVQMVMDDADSVKVRKSSTDAGVIWELLLIP